ncbi:chromate transporter [Caldimonas tepidiphila]|uniref:chromate transporter n=1 Tax=Caldimonas tepidiphila TaxID=2315841 RepID=UPI000E5A8B45|nr:chromate transporter [Caldimonas tepidiphila]
MTTFTWADLPGLSGHLMMLSLMAVGGGVAVVPDMHRFLVAESGWLDEAQFTGSVALAQASPGPNVLFVALMGWHVAMNIQQPAWAPWLAALCLFSMIAPSALLALATTRWVRRHREHRLVQAFHLGMAPVVIALLLASAWFLFPAVDTPDGRIAGAVSGAVAFCLFLRTKVPVWMVLLAAALLGAGTLT